MKTASAAAIAAHIDDYLKATRNEPVLITQAGKPVALLIAIENTAQAKQLLNGRTRKLRSIFKEATEQIDQGRGIPHEQFWREVEKSRGAKRPANVRRKKA